MPFVQINNVVHRYLDEGRRDRPAIVFSNSLGTDLRIWDDVVTRLLSHLRVIRYDKRGHGLSEAPQPPYSANDLANDVVGILDALKIEQAVICGVSVGGVIAQAVALNYPHRVCGLVLCDTGARIGSAEAWQQRMDTISAGGVESVKEMTMERWFSTGFRMGKPADVRGYSNMLCQTMRDGYIGTCAALRDADFRALNNEIKCPTLVLCGALDIATPPELGRELAGSIAGARFELIEGAAHLPCVEQPEAVVNRILGFLREVKLV